MVPLLGFSETLTLLPKAGCPDGVMPGNTKARAWLLSIALNSTAASANENLLIDIQIPLQMNLILVAGRARTDADFSSDCLRQGRWMCRPALKLSGSVLLPDSKHQVHGVPLTAAAWLGFFLSPDGNLLLSLVEAFSDIKPQFSDTFW